MKVSLGEKLQSCLSPQLPSCGLDHRPYSLVMISLPSPSESPASHSQQADHQSTQLDGSEKQTDLPQLVLAVDGAWDIFLNFKINSKTRIYLMNGRDT